MTNDEILQAAKEVGCDVKTDGFITYRDEPVGNMLERFAAIIEKRTIDRCAAICDSVNNYDNPMTATDCAAAIRKLGEQR